MILPQWRWQGKMDVALVFFAGERGGRGGAVRDKSANRFPREMELT